MCMSLSVCTVRVCRMIFVNVEAWGGGGRGVTILNPPGGGGVLLEMYSKKLKQGAVLVYHSFDFKVPHP